MQERRVLKGSIEEYVIITLFPCLLDTNLQRQASWWEYLRRYDEYGPDHRY